MGHNYIFELLAYRPVGLSCNTRGAMFTKV